MVQRKFILLLLLCVMTCASDDLSEDYYEPGNDYIEQLGVDNIWS